MSKQAQFPIFWHPRVIISLVLSFQTSNFCKIKNSKKNSITAQLEKVLCNFFSNFSCCSKSGNQLQEDLVKSGYKTNRELKILGILLHVWEPLELIS
jgi:hypothetical protein